MKQISYTETLTVIPCVTCGMQFAVPDDWDRARREKGDSFVCPNGHSLSYDGEMPRLKRELAAAERREQELKARIEIQERKAKAAAKEKARLARRAQAGVCPCCNRSFVQMTRHMKSQHPDYATK
jgi:hypothetical protein